LIRFLARRLVGAAWVVAGVAVVVFVVLHLSGDPASAMMPPDASAADVARFKHAHGFDQPLIMQFAQFASAAVRGDFGTSLRYGEPALGLAVERLPASAELASAALLIALLFAVPVGVVSAVRRDTPVDYAARLGALIGQSTPVYWLGLMLILLFGVQLGWFPVSGRGGFSHLVLPAITLGLFSMARLMRLTRSSMLDILSSDFVRAAAAKGLSPLRLIVHHALRNAWLPIVTVIGLDLGTLLSQAVIAESIFAWPGLGRLAIQAINDRDYALVEVVMLLAALSFVVVNLLIDLACAALDPRIRYD
jgi:ABC-type dipeptide/oligopeptide/nickel transport system permease component